MQGEEKWWLFGPSEARVELSLEPMQKSNQSVRVAQSPLSDKPLYPA